jgi:hypothetical protein
VEKAVLAGELMPHVEGDMPREVCALKKLSRVFDMVSGVENGLEEWQFAKAGV